MPYHAYMTQVRCFTHGISDNVFPMQFVFTHTVHIDQGYVDCGIRDITAKFLIVGGHEI